MCVQTKKVSLYQPLTASGGSTVLSAKFNLNDTSARSEGNLFLVIGDTFGVEGVFWNIAPVNTQNMKKAPKGSKPGEVSAAYAGAEQSE